jgi:hypothetical protein
MVGSGHLRKLYYLDVTYLNINKTFPYEKMYHFDISLTIINKNKKIK